MNAPAPVAAPPTTPSPFFALPSRAQLRVSLPLCAAFFVFFYAVYGGADLLSHLWSTRWNVHVFGDERAPFVPAMAAVYSSLNVLMLMTPFVRRSPRALTPVVLTMAAQTLIAGVCFALIPVQLAFEHEAPTGLAGTLYAWADTANLCHNELPSLHVTFALTLAWFLGERAGALGKLLLGAWALGIVASTVLIHAHGLVDVAGGVVLAAVGVFAIAPRLARPELLARLPWRLGEDV